eukprot:gene2536-2838_t
MSPSMYGASILARSLAETANYPLYTVLGIACGLAVYTPIRHLFGAADIALDAKARNYGDNLGTNPRFIEKARRYYSMNAPLSGIAHIKNGKVSVFPEFNPPVCPKIGDGVNFAQRWQPRIPDTFSMSTVPIHTP